MLRRLPAERLTEPLRQAWSELQGESPQLASPFCRPEWVEHCAAVRPGIEVGVLHDPAQSDQPVAFFPYARRWGAGAPVGGVLTDFETLIAPGGLDWSPRELLRRCGLRSYRFRNWPADDGHIGDYGWECSASRFIDLSQGFQHYSDSRRGDNRHKLRREISRLRRRAEEQYGSVELRWLGDAPQVVDQLLDWKHAQAAARGWRNGLGAAWVRPLLTRILAHPAPGFHGTIAALYYGERLAAAEYYLRAGNIAHAWLRAFDPELRQFGPGHQLFWDGAEQLAERGVVRIDWGKGDEPFKQKYASGDFPVVSGCLDRSSLRADLRRRAYRLASQGLLGQVLHRARSWWAPARQTANTAGESS